MLEFLIVLAVLTAVIVVVMWPLRRAQLERSAGDSASGAAAGSQRLNGRGAADDLAELEAAREAKYREIRDAELDHRTGKLSDADYKLLDRALRAEAVEILHQLDRAREG